MPEKESTTSEDALLTLAFSLSSSPGSYALLIGAGVSAPSGIPTAWGVLEDLTTRVAQLVGGDRDDPVAWYETTYGEPARYETILEKLAPTPLERQRLLRNYFEPTADDIQAGRKLPTAAHRAIARLVRSGIVKVIITLNFDRLIEQAIRDEHVEPTVIASNGDIEGMAPLHTLDCCIIHLHGDYLNPMSMLNTTAELEIYGAATRKLLGRILDDYGLIVAGWSSVYDPALRNVIGADYPSRLTLAWIEPREPSAEAKELITLKNGLLLAMDADRGFGRIADSVDALLLRNARHPLTVAVAVESAKRELSGRQVSISLHDSLTGELARLHSVPEFHLPDYSTAQPYGGYDAVLGRVEEASRVCSALVATLAYWGSDQTDRWWLPEVERFAGQIRGNGLTNLLSLRLVAAAALFYSAGVAATAARRFDLVSLLLNLGRENPYRPEPELLAAALGDTSEYHSSSLYRLVRPLLDQALALGNEPLDDAWQTFEILRMAKLVMSRSEFPASSAAFESTRIPLIEAEKSAGRC